MKRTLFLGFTLSFLFIGVVATAQSSWSTSKAVNEFANKDLFSSEELAATHLEASANAQPSSVSMKGVSKVSVSSSEKAVGNIPSRGTPSWVNGKGVSAVSAGTRSATQAVEGTEQLIPIDKKEMNK